MTHHGNVTKINGAEVEPVDVITFGAPCQDLSVAGRRSGLKHVALGDDETTRSGLFFEAIRIIKEMREATNGTHPRFAIYENVPGAFSSNKGRDFHAVLEALCSVCDDTVSIPEPYDAKRTKLVWNKAGEIVGDNYSVAWRTLDAQYWGVPQRRKRIYLVADFTGRRAGEILFKPESLRGDLSQGDEAGQGSSADVVGSVDGSVGVECLNPWDSQTIRQYATNGVYPALNSNSGGGMNRQGVVMQAAGFCQGASPAAQTIGYQEEIAPTVKGAPSGTAQVPAVCYPINDKATRFNGGGDTRRNDGAGNGLGVGKESDPSPTVTAADRHAVCYSADCRNGALNRELSTTLQAKPNGGFSYNCISPVVYDARGNGDGETACTITGNHQNRITDYTAVAVQETYQAVTGPLMANSHPGSYTGQDAYSDMLVAGKTPETFCFDETQITSPANGNNPQWNKPSHPLASTARPPTVICKQPPRRYIIRRLLPVECARLQGFPDNWGHLAPYAPADAEFWEDVRKTHAEINGKKYKPVKDIKKWYDKLHTDSAEYKAYGNGLALPNAEFVMNGIAGQGAKTLGSLFDGIGGFPLAGVLNGIKPVWASEVEPYPIAVTKSRFKEGKND